MPAMRLYPAERDRYMADDPRRRVMSIQCGRCGEVYDLTVAAFQGAA